MIRLEAHGYRLALAPDVGATITALDWLHPDHGWREILVPLTDPKGALNAGAFIMAPFANRIADGRFAFEGQPHSLPLNRPDEAMAIHGFAREQIWQVEVQGPDHLRLTLSHQDPALPWQYEMALEVRITPAGITLEFDLTNHGARMPFGFGWHPWFRKGAGTTLGFENAASLRRDGRGLPLPETVAQPAFTKESARALPDLPWFDGVFPNWSPCEAEILWPDQDMAMSLSASGALRHLHVYNPDTRAVFCAEPVSHLPDAVNRSGLPQLDILNPGQSLKGAVMLVARATQPRLQTAQIDASVQQEVSP